MAKAARMLLSLLFFSVATTNGKNTGAPTASPSLAPSLAPTISAAPTTPFPTTTPTSEAPSSAPSKPTSSPTSAPTTLVELCERNLTLTQIFAIMASNSALCPVIISDFSGTKKVYEMSAYASVHPHGERDIYDFCGQDMTKAFTEGPHRHQPFQGASGSYMSNIPINRSAVFTCLGTFVGNGATLTSQPTPVPARFPSINNTVYPCLTPGKEYQIRQVILNKFRSIPESKTNSERAAFNGGLVRLAFHDATTYSAISGEGGPDGCVNLNDPDNAGLKNHTVAMEALYHPFADRISRADFWYLAAVTVIENAGGPMIPFRYGRVDCTEANFAASNDRGRLPLPGLDWFYVRGYFRYALGMTDRDITALFGAHVLGRAHSFNSGFDGPWVGGPSPGMLFTNQFYLGLATAEWLKSDNNFTGFSGRQQWQQANVPTGGQMFLTSDVALLFTNPDNPNCTSSLIDASKVNGNLSLAMPLDPDCIKNSDTVAIVDEYCNSQAAFFRDFAVAFRKLCELGYPEGSLIPTGQCFAGAQTFPNDPTVPSVSAAGTIQGTRSGLLFIVALCLLAFA